MKIENTSKPTSTPLTGGSSSRSAGSSSSVSNDSADVELSGLSAQLLALESAATFDAGRVAEIKQAISEGRFTVNAEAIAGRLIASAKELIESRKG